MNLRRTLLPCRSFFLPLLGFLAIWSSAVLTPATAATLTPGDTVSGTIASAGAFETWTFEAQTGDNVLIKAGEAIVTGDLRPRLQVTGPDGKNVVNAQGFDDADLAFVANNPGTYSVKVDAAIASGRGNYRLTLAQTPGDHVIAAGDQGGDLINGETREGNLYLGDMDIYRFEAVAGDQILVRVGEMNPTPDMRPRVRLYGPTGILVASGQGFDDAEAFTRATNSGPFTVVVDASLAGGSGGYRVTLGTSRGAVSVAPGDEGGVIDVGALQLGSLPIGDLDVYSFTATEGDQIVVRVGELAAVPDLRPRLRLTDPSGVLVDDGQGFDDAEISGKATQSGVYTVWVSASLAGGSGDYRFNVIKSTGPFVTSPDDEGGKISNGELKEGQLKEGDIDVWSFDASAGDRIVVRAGEAAFVRDIRPQLRLYDPNGALVTSAQAFDDVEISAIATNTGRYLILVNGALPGANGRYRLSMIQSTGPETTVPGDQGGPIANGESITGELFPGDLDFFTFTAQEGERFVVRVAEFTLVNDIRPRLRVYGPEGALYADGQDFNDIEITARATNSGPFKILVSASQEGGSGTYRLTLATSAGDPINSAGDDGGLLASGEFKSGQLYSGDIDVWTFDANPGDQLVFRFAEDVLISDIRPRMKVLAPNGEVIASGQDFDDIELDAVATLAGRHSILVSSALSAGAGSYNLNFVRVPTNQTISAGDEGGAIRSGESKAAFLKAGDLDTWTFNAVSNQTVLIRIGEDQVVNDIRPRARLVGPNGVVISQLQGFDSLEMLVRTPQSGLHTLIVSAASLGGSGSYQLHLLQSPGNVFTSDGDEGGLVLNGNSLTGNISKADMDPWLFTSCFGDVLSISVQSITNAGGFVPRVRLFGRDGTLLANAAGVTSATLTFKTPADGTYLAVVSDGSGSSLGAGQYSIDLGGLTAGIKLCQPFVSNGLVSITGAGADPGRTFVLLTSTDLQLPTALWQPITTNTFGVFGEMSYQGTHQTDIPARYFQLFLP